jgi:hypothetical protein
MDNPETDNIWIEKTWDEDKQNKEHNTEIWKDEQHRSLQKPGVNLDAREV